MNVAGGDVKQGKHPAFKVPDGNGSSSVIPLFQITPKRQLWGAFLSSGSSLPRQRRHAPSPICSLIFKPKCNRPTLPDSSGERRLNGKDSYILAGKWPDRPRGIGKSLHCSGSKCNDFSYRTKSASARIKDISNLQKHISTWGKTRETYAQYRKLTGRKQVNFYERHTNEIMARQAAKGTLILSD